MRISQENRKIKKDYLDQIQSIHILISSSKAVFQEKNSKTMNL